jgi:hypothetical protein
VLILAIKTLKYSIYNIASKRTLVLIIITLTVNLLIYRKNLLVLLHIKTFVIQPFITKQT